MNTRFNKQSVSNAITLEIDALKKTYGFDDNDGRSQVAGEDEEMLIAFGRYEALRDLHFRLFNTDKAFY